MEDFGIWEKLILWALCIFSFFPQGLLWSKGNFHISLAHEPHNELSHFYLRLWFTWEHNGPFWPLKMLLWKNWNHFTMGIVMVVVIHLPFLSLFHQNEHTFKHKRWFALAASAAATGRAYCAGYEVSWMNRGWTQFGDAVLLSRMEPLEAESISQRRRSRCHELSRFGYSDYRWIIGENGCLLQDLNQDELV